MQTRKVFLVEHLNLEKKPQIKAEEDPKNSSLQRRKRGETKSHWLNKKHNANPWRKNHRAMF